MFLDHLSALLAGSLVMMLVGVFFLFLNGNLENCKLLKLFPTHVFFIGAIIFLGIFGTLLIESSIG